MVANRVNSVEDGQAVYDKLNTVVSQFLNGNLEYLGMIPQDSMFERCFNVILLDFITDIECSLAAS